MKQNKEQNNDVYNTNGMVFLHPFIQKVVYLVSHRFMIIENPRLFHIIIDSNQN